MEEKWKEGILAATRAYARIMKRGQKWQQRRIPIYIREKLLVPYYITQEGKYQVLHTIKYPERVMEKVAFEVVARRRFDENSAIHNSTQPTG